MAKVEPTKIEIRPVAWAGELVTKYQGFAIVTRPNGQVKKMTGEPMGTKAAALSSLKHEMQQRTDDINSAVAALKDFVLE